MQPRVDIGRVHGDRLARKARRIEAWRRLASDLDRDKLGAITTTLPLDRILSAKKIVIAVQNDVTPYSLLDANNQLDGLDIEVGRQIAKDLGFDAPTRNSLDTVSDRDFALDYLMAASQCALHLSRLAEELIIWASQPFGFVVLPDSLSTGSSIMPQKRNPDAAELVRAALAHTREQGLKVRPLCSYVQAYMRRHPEVQSLLA